MASDVVAPRNDRGPRSITASGNAVELVVGVFLLGLASLAGLAFIRRPWANRLDVWGDGVFPANFQSLWAHDFVALGSLTALIVGAIAIFVIGLSRDWVRAAACATAPVVAVLIVQDLAKPLVGRHFGLGGGSSFPSGTVTAVAALATAAVLVVPRILRPAMLLAAMAAIAGVSAAVIVLRWHYPTDALGGMAVGVGAVLAIDALFHIPWVVAGLLRTHTEPRRLASRQHPRMA
jgi:membrane-associated phospholipid phosphatase